MSNDKLEWGYSHEACEMLSYCADDYSFSIMFRNEENEDVIVSFPLHEDFLDAFLFYKRAYTEHINKRLNEWPI